MDGCGACVAQWHNLTILGCRHIPRPRSHIPGSRTRRRQLLSTDPQKRVMTIASRGMTAARPWPMARCFRMQINCNMERLPHTSDKWG